jgi:predicted acetyltransferase
MYFVDEPQDGRTNLRCIDGAYDSPQALVRKLRFLGSLRDQYSSAIIQLPVDVPLNWLLKETQLPHRLVEHPVARVQPLNRLQVRILDHARFLDGQKLPVDTSGKTTVGVREIEGSTSVVSIEIEKGHVHAKPASGSADVEVADKVWAAIACGEVSATTMSQLGLLTVNNQSGLKELDAFSHGPPPFCNERF